MEDLKRVPTVRVVAREPETGREWDINMSPMVATLFDPWSYTSTVENLFFFSRLVKDGWCGMFWARSTNGPEDGPGAPVEGKVWEPHIIAYSIEELKAFSISKRTTPVPANAVIAAAGGASPAAASSRRATLDLSRQAAEVAQAKRLLGKSLQAVVELDYDSWKKLIKEKKLKAPALSHRKTADSTAPMGFKFFVDGKKRGEEEDDEE